MTNLFDVIVGAEQVLSLSLEARLATYVGGEYTFISERGLFRLASVMIQEHGTLAFESPDIQQPAKMSLGRLEVDYGGAINVHSLLLEGNELLLHPGSSIDATGGNNNHPFEELGAGQVGDIFSLFLVTLEVVNAHFVHVVKDACIFYMSCYSLFIPIFHKSKVHCNALIFFTIRE